MYLDNLKINHQNLQKFCQRVKICFAVTCHSSWVLGLDEQNLVWTTSKRCKYLKTRIDKKLGHVAVFTKNNKAAWLFWRNNIHVEKRNLSNIITSIFIWFMSANASDNEPKSSIFWLVLYFMSKSHSQIIYVGALTVNVEQISGMSSSS